MRGVSDPCRQGQGDSRRLTPGSLTPRFSFQRLGALPADGGERRPILVRRPSQASVATCFARQHHSHWRTSGARNSRSYRQMAGDDLKRELVPLPAPLVRRPGEEMITTRRRVAGRRRDSIQVWRCSDAGCPMPQRRDSGDADQVGEMQVLAGEHDELDGCQSALELVRDRGRVRVPKDAVAVAQPEPV